MSKREEKLIDSLKTVLSLYYQGLISMDEAREATWKLIYETPGVFLVP